jgi:hypothetical protein
MVAKRDVTSSAFRKGTENFSAMPNLTFPVQAQRLSLNNRLQHI